jgi:hypothetical protein
MKYLGFLIIMSVLHGLLAAQQTIPIRNGSFEDAPGHSKIPKGWQSSPGSTPDIQPGAWGIQVAPQDGSSCVGLVTRDDGTSEDIGQALTETLQGGVCYALTIYLSHASNYVGYNHPVRLRVWGGQGRGKKEILLTSSPLIDHSDWRSYKLQFIPASNVKYIIFEAYFGPGTTFKYKGNILLDNCSAIEKCDRA